MRHVIPSCRTSMMVSSPAIRSQYFFKVLRIDIVSHAAGIARRVRMTAMFPENCSEMNPLYSISPGRLFCRSLVHDVVGRVHIHVPTHACRFGNFQLFRSRERVACVSSKPSRFNSYNAPPETDLLAGDNHLDGI